MTTFTELGASNETKSPQPTNERSNYSITVRIDGSLVTLNMSVKGNVRTYLRACFAYDDWRERTKKTPLTLDAITDFFKSIGVEVSALY
jgi:hypothetical protein